MTHSVQQRLDTLDGDLLRLLKELENHADETLNRPPGPGRWSALQVMHHLMKAEDLSFRYVEKKLSFNPKLPPAGLGTRLREWLLRAYLNAPFKFKAPKNVGAEVLPAQSSFRNVADAWLAQRRALRALLESLPEETFRRESYRHPFAGRITLDGMLHFFQAHFERHRKQIRRTLAQLAKA